MIKIIFEPTGADWTEHFSGGTPFEYVSDAWFQLEECVQDQEDLDTFQVIQEEE